jgi:hypothetical protein
VGRLFLPALVALVGVGCASYRPEHLDSLYSQRDQFQKLIDQVEKKYDIPSRDPVIRAQQEREHRARVARAEQERALERARHEEEQAFLGKLDASQRLTWMMHQDLMQVQREDGIRRDRMHFENIEARRRDAIIQAEAIHSQAEAIRAAGEEDPRTKINAPGSPLNPVRVEVVR